MRTKLFFLFSLTILLLFLSCGENNNNENNVSSGVPVSFTYSDGQVVTYSYTNGNKLSKITYGNLGESVSFTYSGSNVTQCNFTYNTGNRGDSVQINGGISDIVFSKVGNSRILAKINTADDAKDVYVDTIDIGTTGFPNIISYKRGLEDHYIQYFFVLDSTQTKIAEQDVLLVYNTSTLLASKCIYEYDNNPGTTSLVDFPKWLSVYIRTALLKDISDKQLFNCVNNVTKEIYYDNGSPNPTATLNHVYNYGDDRFPSSVLDGAMQEKITIKY